MTRGEYDAMTGRGAFEFAARTRELRKVREAAALVERAALLLDCDEWDGVLEDLNDIADALRCGADYLERPQPARAVEFVKVYDSQDAR